MKKKPEARRKAVKLTARRREAMELVKFIDAHGGRLGAFRGYGAAQLRPPGTSPASRGERGSPASFEYKRKLYAITSDF